LHYDIAIIGGGMVGAALACALKNTPFRIALIDASATSVTDDKRLIALNHHSCELLKKLDLWPADAAAIQSIHISHRGHFGITRLNAHDMHLTALGHVIPAKEINAALYAELETLSNVDLLRPAKLTALMQHDEHVALTLDTARTIQATLVIAADGTYSTVRENLNIPTETIDYQQKALVTVTTLQRHHGNIAYERFLSSGAIAMLPLTANRVATIWSDQNDEIDKLLALSDEAFLQQLQTQFGYRLGKLKSIESRATYPLKFVKAQKQILNRILLIGNAAHTVHPVAAQGLNLALREITVLVNYLKNHTTLSFDELSEKELQQSINLHLSHYLTHLFSTDFFVLNQARQVGMIGLDIFSPLKKWFLGRMTGNRVKPPCA
jgi:2-octaprenyl-6-methoxyphenol hydroxylase